MAGKKDYKKNFGLEHWHIIALGLILYDTVSVNAAYLFALLLRFDLRFSMIEPKFLSNFYWFAPLYTVFCIVIFYRLRLYKSIWRFASYDELIRLAAASVATSLFQVVGMTVLHGRMPTSYYIVGAGLQFVLAIGVRFSYRFVLLLRGRRGKEELQGKHTNIMIVGAGNAGQMILRDVKRSPQVSGVVRCFIDDNPNKHGRYIDGIPVVGGRDDILYACNQYSIDRIYLAIPSATAAERRDILDICKETGCELKNLPGVYQFMTGEVSVSKMKDVDIADLLGRDQIKVDLSEIFAFLSGKTILVTGGGGSIGSELCRQIAKHSVKRLIVVDIYENNAYDLQQELLRNVPNLDLVVLIASVRDSRRMEQIFAQYRPEIVFHAAAHKHVPLMEGSPNESIKNNVFGTYKTALAAMHNGCQRFVLISTDKAVNPTNIMGASKRLCEMIVQSFDRKVKAHQVDHIPVICNHEAAMAHAVCNPEGEVEAPRTEFVAVRFGNVLGSNGSVIPLFRKQIAAGGPVTVTHPDIIRYFMTIPEAVSLVLQAGTYAKGGEIFVLDMGSPVKIDTLARNLIKLSGYRPDEDIKIEYVGLRPGEKLYEEKLMAEEGLQKTRNELIHIGSPIPFDEDAFLQSLPGLLEAASENDDRIREYVARLVNTYHPAGQEEETTKKEILSKVAVGAGVS